MYKILFLVLFASFFLISCEDTEVSTSCIETDCNSWESCQAGKCQLKPGSCNITSDCDGILVCTNHSCADAENPCGGVACSGNGNCLVSGTSAVCVCNNGFHTEGLDCVKDAVNDPCDNITCSVNGSCAVSGGNPICICKSGYHAEGIDCVLDVNNCDDIDCSGNGSCVLSGDTAMCLCDNGFHSEGLNCFEDVDLCSDITCSDNGRCATSNDMAICVCDAGYHSDGLDCVKDTAPCNNVTCSNHGTCLLSGDDAVCICNFGYFADGLNCEEENPCENVICDNWETCIEGSCNLKPGQCGSNGDCLNTDICDSNNNCVDPVNPCDGITCSGNGDCADASGDAVCVCVTGYTADGLNCISDTHPCDGIECSSNGQCVVSGGDTPICLCDTGYHNQGLNCIEDIDICLDVTCSNHGVCTSSNDEAICICDGGYYVDGLTCLEDIDPCDNITCGSNGSCAVSGGDAICVCTTGYHPEGLTCIEDIDNCDGVDCSGLGSCTLSGDIAMCLCDIGYHPEGLTCVEDIDPCLDVMCSSHGTCYVSGSEPICVCDDGFENDALECVQFIGAGDLIISEFMANPTVVSDTLGEWIELYNTTTRTLNLDGVTIVKDNTATVISGSVAPNSYFVIARSGDALIPFDTVASFSALANTGSTFSIQSNGVILHEITYPSALTGKSWQLDVDSYDFYDDFSSFCAASDEISAQNLDLGTPGTANILCAVASLCDGVTCDNHGTCDSDEYDFLCFCDNGYTDIDNSDDCAACDTGYVRDTSNNNCILDVATDLCDGITCDSHGDCLADNVEYICICDDGYTDTDNEDDCEACEIGYSRDGNSDCVEDSVQNIQVDDLIITEVMANPDFVSDTNGEWIEIYNTTTSDILLEDFSIVREGNIYSLLESGNIVPANSYFVITRNSSANLPQIDTVISSISLTNSPMQTVSINMGSLVVNYIDTYGYDAGISWKLDPSGSWCNSTTVISVDNDDLGTPGLENPMCGVVDLCDGVECNNGECLSDETEYVCVCDTEYDGDFCDACAVGYVFDADGVTCIAETCTNDDTDIFYCGNNDNGLKDVVCVNNVWEDDGVCLCDTGYIGDNCDTCESGYKFDADGVTCILDTSDNVTIAWCNVQWPASIEADWGDNPTTVYGQVYIDGVTNNQDTAHTSVIAQMGYNYYDDSVDIATPINKDNFIWLNSTFNLRTDRTDNNHEYNADFPTDDAYDFNYIYRFSGDNGSTWTYCDLNGVITDTTTVSAGYAYISILR